MEKQTTTGRTEAYAAQINNILQDKYCICFEDTGFSLEEWLLRFDGLDASDAVKCYADKYDLTCKAELLL